MRYECLRLTSGSYVRTENRSYRAGEFLIFGPSWRSVSSFCPPAKCRTAAVGEVSDHTSRARDNCARWGGSRGVVEAKGFARLEVGPRELSEMTKRSQDGPYRFLPAPLAMPARFTGPFTTNPTLANVPPPFPVLE